MHCVGFRVRTELMIIQMGIDQGSMGQVCTEAKVHMRRHRCAGRTLCLANARELSNQTCFLYLR